METVSIGVVLSLAMWIAVCAAAAWFVYQRREVSGVLPERAFVLSAILLFAIAPISWLIVRTISGDTTFFAGGLQVLVGVTMLAAAWRARRQRESGSGSFLHFPEKSALLVLLALVIVFGSFIVRALDASPEQASTAFVQSLGMFIAIMVVGHAIIALFHAPIGDVDRAPDERDRRVRLLSSRNAYYLLTVGFWSIPIMLIANLSLSQILIGWFLALLISEILYYSSVLFYYRFGSA